MACFQLTLPLLYLNTVHEIKYQKLLCAFVKFVFLLVLQENNHLTQNFEPFIHLPVAVTLMTWAELFEKIK